MVKEPIRFSDMHKQTVVDDFGYMSFICLVRSAFTQNINNDSIYKNLGSQYIFENNRPHTYMWYSYNVMFIICRNYRVILTYMCSHSSMYSVVCISIILV